MPRRTYRQKNRFVLNSTIDEGMFATILYRYLQVKSAQETRDEILAELEPGWAPPPSTKTISQLFRRLGRFLFHKLSEPLIVWAQPAVMTAVKTSDLDYDDFLDGVCEHLILNARKQISYESYLALQQTPYGRMRSDALALELRFIMAKRRGIKSDARADIGLAEFRLIHFKRDSTHELGEEVILKMMSTFLGWLHDNPLDSEGNPNQVFLEATPRIPYGNYNLPTPKKSK